jgi:alkanesulfonate monooxygenase SsuD/methylene tetrahydromethanopterin reductase-like flavin-dependent oxidoreductase (luciferase family)
MPETVLRLDMRAPEFGTPITTLYRSALEMAEWADRNGVDVVMLSEHHGSEDSFLPAPMVLAGAIAARTERIRIRIAAVPLPLHHPAELAEQTTVVDQISGGRVELVVTAGYVQKEFALFDRRLDERSRLMDEGVEYLAGALAGESVQTAAGPVHITPRSVQRPRPPLYIGGGVRASARRAARWGDGFYPPTPEPAIRNLYYEECAKIGRTPGRIIESCFPLFVHVTESPEKDKVEIAPHAMHELNSFVAQAESTEGDFKSPYAAADSPEAVWAYGLHRVVTPDECVTFASELDQSDSALVLAPLMGGLSPDIGWASLELFASKVLPKLANTGQAFDGELKTT